MNNLKNILPKIIETSILAGLETLKIYQKDFQIALKSDQSPLTEADIKSNAIIMETLKKYSYPIISEENELTNYTERKNWKEFWLVDPLDGTKEFIKKNDDYTINIAFVSENIPVLGVIYVPVFDTLYFGLNELGAYKLEKASEVMSRKPNLDVIIENANKLPFASAKRAYTVVTSKSHLTQKTKDFVDLLVEKHSEIEFSSRGSSLKFCLLAEGKADIYPRFGPTMEWDIAAGVAILLNSNGRIYVRDTKETLSFNKKNLLNPDFIAEC